MRAGRAFIFEHPATASSWEIGGLQRLRNASGVHEALLDMCRFGMTSWDESGEGLVRKTTRILTNAEEVADLLGRRCDGGHRHVQLMSGRAKAAAVYSQELCRAMIQGFDLWKRRVASGAK